MADVGEAAKKAANNMDRESEKLANNVRETADEAKSKVSEAISTGGEAVQKAKESTQKFVSEKADQIGTYAHQVYDKAYDKAGQLGNRASEAISNSADYVRNLDVEKARDAVKNTVQEKPELSIVIAAMTGLVIGLIIGRTGRK